LSKFRCVICVPSFLETVTYWDTDKKNIHADWKMGTSNSKEKLKEQKKKKIYIYIYIKKYKIITLRK